MKSKKLQLFFLVLVGLIMGWREWTSSNIPTSEKFFITKLQELNETGSAYEATVVLVLFLTGTILAIVIQGLILVPKKLSSPNSV